MSHAPDTSAYADKWAIAVAYAPLAEDEPLFSLPLNDPNTAVLRSQYAERALGASGAPPPPPPEVAALLSLATTRRELAFCTDEGGPGPSGTVPLCSTYDLTSDPIAYFADREALVASAKAAVASSLSNASYLPGGEAPPLFGPDPADAYALLHSLLHTSSTSVATGGVYVAKHIGGTALPSPPRAALRPVSPANQAAALAHIVALLTGDSLYPTRCVGSPSDPNVPCSAFDELVVRGSSPDGPNPPPDGADVDADALALFPAPLFRHARSAKRRILEAAMAASRGAGLSRASASAVASASPRADGGAPLDAQWLVDGLQDAVWGAALGAAMRAAGGPGGDAVCAAVAAVAASLSSQPLLCGGDDGFDCTEVCALHSIWIDVLRAASSGSGGPDAAAGETAAAAAAARAEARGALQCVPGVANATRRTRLYALRLLEQI